VTEKFRQLFGAQHPLWACEFTARQMIVAGVDRTRTRIQARTAEQLPQDATADHPEILRPIVERTLKSAAFDGSEIAVVIPDDAARIAFITAETLPKTLEEQQTFLRWKLKKTVPFDVDTAQLSFRVVRERPPAGYDVVVALSPRDLIEAYENLLDELDVHAGFVVPSTLAAANLLNSPEEDTLFVKIAPDCVTTTVFQNKQMTFYRRVAELGLYESVYPTVLYYQDKLGGSSFARMVVCGDHADIAELSERIGILSVPLEPRNVDDVYKPALGAVHLS